MGARKGKKEPSIVDGLLLRSSPSQIKTFELCNLKWGYDKVWHLPTKQSKGAALGDKCHGELEHFELTGEDVRGRIPRAGAHLLEPYIPRMPFRGGDILVEAPLADICRYCKGCGTIDKKAEIECPICKGTGRGSDWKVVTPGGVRLVGYIDLLIPDPIEPHIIDHKFKKSLEKYGSSEEELQTDIQSICYGMFALIQFPTAQRVRFTLHEHQTEGRQYARPVSAVLTRDQILKEWAAFAALLDGPMRAAARLTKPEEFGRDENKCGAYGGCDFKETCPFSPGNKYAASLLSDASTSTVAPQNKDRKTMGLLDTIPAGGTTAKPASTPPTPPAQPKPAGLTAKDAKTGQKYRVAGKVGTFQAAAGDRAFFTDESNAPFAVGVGESIELHNPTPTPPPAETKPAGLTAKDAKHGVLYMVTGKAATFQAPMQMNGQDLILFAEPGGAPFMVPASETIVAVNVPTANAPAAVLAADAPASDPAKATTTPQEADEEEEEVEEVAATGTITSEPATPAEKAKGKPGRKPKAEGVPAGLVLVIDGVAFGGGTDLSGYVNEIAAKVAAAAGAKDPRLAGNDTALGYGKWRGFMAQAARETPPSGLCYVQRGDLADAVIEGLASVASVVIRPVR